MVSGDSRIATDESSTATARRRLMMPAKRSLFWLAGLFLILAMAVLWLAAESQSVPGDGGVLARIRSVIQGDASPPQASKNPGRQIDTSTIDFSPPPGATKPKPPSIAPTASELQSEASAAAGTGANKASPDRGGASRGATRPRADGASPVGPTGQAQTKSTGPATPANTPTPAPLGPANATIDFETPPGVGSPRGTR
jgi:hypothetical protein